jgi:hypothetical protein
MSVIVDRTCIKGNKLNLFLQLPVITLNCDRPLIVELIRVSDDQTRPIPPGWPRQPDPRGAPGGPGGGGSYRDGWGQNPQGDRDGAGGQTQWNGGRDQRDWGGQRGAGGAGGQRDWGGAGGAGGETRWNGGDGQGDWGRAGGQDDWGRAGGQDDRGHAGGSDEWGHAGGQGGGPGPERGGQDAGRGGRDAGRGSARPRRRHRGLTITAVIVVVLLILLVVADRVAAGIAENEAASQIKSAGFPVKPKVTIAGFPFLTQLAARDFHHVNISASNVKEGPLDIASINATGQGVHLTSSFNGATVDQINGTALVTFAGLSSAAGIGDGITLSNAGHNELKASINLGFVSGDAIAQVTRHGSHKIEVKVINAGPIPLSALGNVSDFTVSLPNLPAGMTVRSVSVTDQGVLISISGSHTSFGG